MAKSKPKKETAMNMAFQRAMTPNMMERKGMMMDEKNMMMKPNQNMRREKHMGKTKHGHDIIESSR